MGIPIQIVGEGIDWPAWVQAVGSVLAIGIAIWIDQGTARRNRAQEARLRQQSVADWEACLSEVLKLAKNAERIASRERDQTFDDTIPARLIDNAIMMIDAYLRQPPPSPKLAFALSAARSYLEWPKARFTARRAIALNRGAERETALANIRSMLLAAAESIEALVEEYRQGLL